MSCSAAAVFVNRRPLAWNRSAPQLCVVVDTEEEFDWGTPFSREATAVSAMRHQEPAQRLFERFGIVPAYMITWAVASQAEGRQPLREFLAAGACEVGAHLHPWINPPLLEPVSRSNSYAGNLPPALELAKLRLLTSCIEQELGVRPVLYKAGRYGLGPHTAEALEQLGYKVDLSALPHHDLRADGGPDYRFLDATPFRFGPSGRLLELPMTVGFSGVLRRHGAPWFESATRGLGRRLRVGGVLARSGLIERIRLSPEGIDHRAHRRLVRALLDGGQRLFSLTYHSPSLMAGCTPYVRDAAGLERFTDTIERFLDFFMGELGGEATTPTRLAAEAEALASSA
ncbi:polysaccharide deacetylase family protein [Geminicoccaceae bacterium 1502E]|nr:polysaccharide deacetylase family protein [Geminicoccaceae bacterium 1502E]